MSGSPPSPSKEADQPVHSPDADNPDMDSGDPHALGGGFDYDGVKEQDRWLPIANVARIMKNALPENAKIAKEAKECMQECVSEFISFITSEASEKCQQEKRKTVNGEDILFAMTSLGFENYSEALKVYLSKYREQQNQSNRERVMDNNAGWQGGLIQGEKGDSAGEGVEGTADPNYMYTAQAGHNGNGTGEGY